MPLEFKEDKYINIVGTVDLDGKTGEILYVTPTAIGLEGTDAPAKEGIRLIFEDREGNPLLEVHPFLRRNECDEGSNIGLIQQDVKYIKGMRSIRLLLNDEELDRYVASHVSSAPEGLANMSQTPAAKSRSNVGIEGFEEKKGITYSIMARPDGEELWQALGVGLAKPHFQWDENQFPGKKKATIRVIQTTGFDDQIIAEEVIRFGESL